MPTTCPVCRRTAPDHARFCSHCGSSLDLTITSPSHPRDHLGELNLSVLYGMAVLLVLAVIVPPWEAPPTDPPAFLGLHPFWSAPTPTAIISRMLLTIETTTIAIGGLYSSWLFRRK